MGIPTKFLRLSHKIKLPRKLVTRALCDFGEVGLIMQQVDRSNQFFVWLNSVKEV